MSLPAITSLAVPALATVWKLLHYKAACHSNPSSGQGLGVGLYISQGKFK